MFPLDETGKSRVFVLDERGVCEGGKSWIFWLDERGVCVGEKSRSHVSKTELRTVSMSHNVINT